MIGIDSNILLRWIIDDPSSPEQSRKVRERLSGEMAPLYINHVVLAETIWVLQHPARVGPDAVAAIVATLIEAPNIRLQQPDVVEGALAAFTEASGGFTDHLIGALNRGAGCTTTLTFDRAAAKSAAFTELQ